MNLDSEETLALARDGFENNRLDEALGRVKNLLAEQEPIAGARELAARIYARLRLFPRAISLLEQCLEQEPGSLERRVELAMVHQDSGDRNTALKEWEDLLLQHPLMPPALFNAAWLRAEREQLAEAHRHLEVLLQTAPQDNLYTGRARELKRMLQERSQSTSEPLGEILPAAS
jgi:tetratricopeptide (TPR) repeat protein